MLNGGISSSFIMGRVPSSPLSDRWQSYIPFPSPVGIKLSLLTIVDVNDEAATLILLPCFHTLSRYIVSELNPTYNLLLYPFNDAKPKSGSSYIIIFSRNNLMISHIQCF